MVYLAVSNSEEDLHNARMDKQVVECKCKGCGYKWVSTIGDMRDDPTCRKCKR